MISLAWVIPLILALAPLGAFLLGFLTGGGGGGLNLGQVVLVLILLIIAMMMLKR